MTGVVLSRRERLFWLCVGLLFLIGIIALIPSHYEICEVSEKTKEEHCDNYQVITILGIKIPQYLDRMGGVLTALATIAIAAFTLTLKRATDRLWDAGERQLGQLRDTAERQLRAYVGLQKGEVINLDNTEAVQANIVFKNAGQTPAYKLYTWGGMSVRTYPGPVEIPPPNRDPALVRKSLVLPGAEFGRTESGEIPQSAKTDIIAGRATLFVYGEIHYLDAFGQEHSQSYRYFCGAGHPNSITQSKGKTVGRLAPHEDGNDES